MNCNKLRGCIHYTTFICCNKISVNVVIRTYGIHTYLQLSRYALVHNHLQLRDRSSRWKNRISLTQDTVTSSGIPEKDRWKIASTTVTMTSIESILPQSSVAFHP